MALFHTTVLDNQIKALPTVDTASGSIATFDTDLTENLVEVKCQIVAKQASGTPSPVNPLPITVYNALNLEMTNNDNLICGFISNANIDGTGKIVSNTSFNMAYALVIKGETYIVTADISNTIVCGYYSDIPQVGSLALDNTRHIYSGYVFTADKTGFVCFRMNNTYTTPQLEKGNTATAYKDYTNNIGIHIPFGQTVANGAINVVTGKLRVTSGMVDLSTLTWVEQGLNTGVYRATDFDSSNIDAPTGYNDTPDLIAEDYVTSNWGAIVDYHLSNAITVRNVGTAVTPDIRLIVSNTTPTGKICYKLATPIEIQLDSITLQALLNENNVWCDTGDTEVKFLLTVGKKIS